MPRITITVPEKTSQPYRFQLDRQVVTFGRGDENDIVLDSGSVSVRHAEMRRISGGYELKDIGSTNGLKLMGERHDVVPLKNGVSIHIGDVLFDFVLTEDEVSALALEKSPAALPTLPAVAVAQVSDFHPQDMTVAVKLAPAIPLPELPVFEQRPVIVAKPQPAPRRQSYAPESSGTSLASILMFLIFAALAFFAGLSVRFQRETGGNLFDAIKLNNATVVPPAAPVPPVTPITTAPKSQPVAPLAPMAPAIPPMEVPAP